MIEHVIAVYIAIFALAAVGYNIISTEPGAKRRRGPAPRSQVHTKYHHNRGK
jgi:hypothetical protein